MIKIPFWFQPAKHFVGKVAYRKTFTVPSNWVGKNIMLYLERVHISSVVWVDGKEVGRDNSLSTPHQFDLGKLSRGSHELVVVVDNEMIKNIGENSHSVTDHMQTAWNGIVGEIRLNAVPESRIEDLQVFPDVAGKRIRITWKEDANTKEGRWNFIVSDPDGKKIQSDAVVGMNETTLSLGDNVATWDEFSPRLYRLEATLTLPNGDTSVAETTFGMVDYRVEGKQFLVNGRPTIFRGTLECAMFPMTGYPSTDVAYWKNVYSVVKSHGLNHVRFHSWCPPEAAFVAADEVGIYLLAEHAWTNPELAGEYLMNEAERVVNTYGNHPSFVMHSYGNEPIASVEWMENFAKHFRETDPRRLTAGSIGWPVLKNNQFHSLMDGLRVYPWAAGLGSSINAEKPNTRTDFGKKTASDNKPMMSHETGQWCVYPDFNEIDQYTGFLKAKNFEIFREFLTNNHMADQAHDFLMASGRLQMLCYKYEIEKLLRTPDIGGFQLLGLNDFPGQGTALVGWVNPLWKTKPYATTKESNQFLGQSVPLARLPKFVYTSGETLTAKLEMSHYAANALVGATPIWRIVGADGKTLLEGKLDPRTIPIGQSVLGNLEVPLAQLPTPSQVKLVVGVADTNIENSWDIWIYPATEPQVTSDKCFVTNDVLEALEKAESGGNVLLMPSKSAIVKPEGPNVVFAFSTIFWNTAWTKRQPPTTMGILCNPQHAALKGFPTDFHTNYQWWDIVQLVSRPLSLQGQDPEMRPIVQVIDDWHTARRLGLIVEARYGKGKLLVSAIDFDEAEPDNVVANQLRSSLIAYMASPDFAPKTAWSFEQFSRMIKKSDVKVTASSQDAHYPADALSDGDPTTLWHSNYRKVQTNKYPYEIKIDFRKIVLLKGLKVLPRQDGTPNGLVKDIKVMTSMDGNTWASAAESALHDNPNEWNEIKFPTVQARFLKIIAVSPQRGGNYATFAEISPDVEMLPKK